jgi:hypothetical protein
MKPKDEDVKMEEGPKMISSEEVKEEKYVQA